MISANYVLGILLGAGQNSLPDLTELTSTSHEAHLLVKETDSLHISKCVSGGANARTERKPKCRAKMLEAPLQTADRAPLRPLKGVGKRTMKYPSCTIILQRDSRIAETSRCKCVCP